jgi:hypothetical protein
MVLNEDGKLYQTNNGGGYSTYWNLIKATHFKEENRKN